VATNLEEIPSAGRRSPFGPPLSMLSLERQAYSLIPKKRFSLLPSHYSFFIFLNIETGGGKFPKVLPWTSRLPVLYRDPLR